MKIGLGWLAVVAGLAGEPVPRVDGPEISYKFQVVEMRGLQWRTGYVPGLKPIASHGGVTVWTAPSNFLASLPDGTVKTSHESPQINAGKNTPAHYTSRKSHPLITQVSWRGQSTAPRQTTEMIREGMAATISGRPIDQGVLVNLVAEDTEVRSVHTVAAVAPPKPAPATCQPTKTASHSNVDVDVETIVFRGDSDIPEEKPADASGKTPENTVWTFSTKDAQFTAKTTFTINNSNKTDKPCCTATKVAAAATPCNVGITCCQPVASETPEPSFEVQVPEIGRAEIAGEWLIPHDEVLLVGFGPHTIADDDGKAVVRERLAVITANETDGAPMTVSAEPIGLALPVPRIASPAPIANPLPVPALPSRTLPQGVHIDGTVADLPPLPDQADADTDFFSDPSSEPRPSPQTRKPRGASSADEPQPAKPKATSDERTTKTSYKFPNLFKQSPLTQLMAPNLQFMMPLKPFEMKLPFNQKLEVELVGRVVPDYSSDNLAAAPSDQITE
jgi:hypothetical protein